MPTQGIGIMRRQTLQFINQNPSDVVFIRTTREDDGAGGTRASDPVPLTPQTVRLVSQVSGAAVERHNVSGEVVMPEVTVVAEYSADLQRGDTFDYNGTVMEIVWIEDLEYEIKAEAATL